MGTGPHSNHDHGDHDHDHSGHDRERAHGHGHDHSFGHSHAPASFGTAFAIGIGLNAAFVVVEALFGYASNSTALIADAGHNLSDVLGLAVAWIAEVMSRRAPSARFTYGLRGSSILAALFNAVFLLIVVGAIGWEALLRLFDPEPVGSTTVIVVAAIGIVINGITALLFAAGRKDDLNIRGAYLHMAADALVSAGVVGAGAAITWTGWLWIDPVTSLIVSALIVAGTWSLLRDSAAMSLDAVPADIDAEAVRTFLEARSGVSEVHDLHIWSMSTRDVALTCHLVMPGGRPDDRFLFDICDRLKRDYGIQHTTIQVETDEASRCPLAPAHVV
jgi:cobalt-zinc-cadmium efflux system protein